MALAKILTPPNHMVLHQSESSRDEPRHTGLRLLPSKTPNQSILLNATYNHFTITNHFRSKEQIEVNSQLKKSKKQLNEAFLLLQKRYNKAKKVLDRIIPLLNENLSQEETQYLGKIKEKWEIHNKRKMNEEQNEFISKKRKINT